MRYSLTVQPARLAALAFASLLLAACDQSADRARHAPPVAELEMLRNQVNEYQARIVEGTANRGDSVSYIMQNLGLQYAEAAYLHEVTETALHNAEQLVQTLGKTGGVPTEMELKQIAAELGTPFFKVETSDAGRRVEVLDLSQVPFDHVAHLQPTLLTYGVKTPSGRVTVQIVLPGSFNLISEYLAGVGYPASALLPGSGKAAEPGVPWQSGMPLPYEVPDCQDGGDRYIIVHPEYGSYYNCAVVVSGGGGGPSTPAPITCIICDDPPSPSIPPSPGYPWPPYDGPIPDPGPNGGFSIQATSDVGRASVGVRTSDGSKYQFSSKIGYQMVGYGYAPLDWLQMESVRSEYEANVREVFKLGAISFTADISAALKSAGFSVGISGSSNTSYQDRVLLSGAHTYPAQRQIESTTLLMATACQSPQVSTSLKLTNRVDGQWSFDSRMKSGNSASESSSGALQCGYVL